MRNLGKHNLLGVLVDAVDQEMAVERVIAAATSRRPLAVSAIAVHGVMEAVMDPGLRHRVNRLDLVAPDGQPVRWGLNLLYRADLGEPVRGTDLAVDVCGRAAVDALPVFFYGSRPAVLRALSSNLKRRFPTLAVAGTHPSLFRPARLGEQDGIVETIKASGARITFVGLGCPRQEIFVSELRDALGMPVIAVGAAFDYLAGTIPEPPVQVRRLGLEWLWRLLHEPRRLWRRYLLLNPAYLVALGFQAFGIWRPNVSTGPRATGLPL
jgi:N-acetylglucosaminyldiphosphoundecaprenol N-acetyl-beta-D-mannosaminyltransferase